VKISCPKCGVQLGNRHQFCPGCGIRTSERIRSQQERRRILVLPVEIPTAFDALGKDYEAKAINLHEENALLKKKVEELEKELEHTKLALIQEQGERAKEATQILKLNNDLYKAAIAIGARDCVIKEKLNIQTPNPSK